jgi:hypothetical protein
MKHDGFHLVSINQEEWNEKILIHIIPSSPYSPLLDSFILNSKFYFFSQAKGTAQWTDGSVEQQPGGSPKIFDICVVERCQLCPSNISFKTI